MNGSDGPPTAILVETSAERVNWLVHRLDAIERYTADRNHRVYVWIDGEPDARVVDALAPSGARLEAGEHADVLPVFCAEAERLGARHLVVLGADLVPIGPTWLPELIGELEADASAVSLVIDDGGPVERRPIACAAADAATLTVGDHTSGQPRIDAPTQGRRVHELHRTDREQAPAGIPGGVYGGRLYRHDVTGLGAVAAGGDPAERAGVRQLTRVYDQLICEHERDYLAWRQGSQTERMVLFVLGMHRSGTSSLTGCLAKCGLSLGEVNRTALIDQPRGNFERLSVVALNDAILSAAGGTWSAPPSAADLATVWPKHSTEVEAIVSALEANGPAGMKDPRTLITLDAWLAAAADWRLIGTFRQPSAVAQSLWDRDLMPVETAYELWNAYNERLVQLHRTYGFPLIEFDLGDREGYARRVAAAAAELGLRPDIDTVANMLAPPHPTRQPHEADPVPEVCRATYTYLREHRYEGVIEEDTFAATVMSWAELRARTRPTQRPNGVADVMWAIARRLPRSVRPHFWRAWKRVSAGRGDAGAASGHPLDRWHSETPD